MGSEVGVSLPLCTNLHTHVFNLIWLYQETGNDIYGISPLDVITDDRL